MWDFRGNFENLHHIQHGLVKSRNVHGFSSIFQEHLLSKFIELSQFCDLIHFFYFWLGISFIFVCNPKWTTMHNVSKLAALQPVGLFIHAKTRAFSFVRLQFKAPSHQASASTDGNVPQHFRRHAMPTLSVHKPITFTHGPTLRWRLVWMGLYSWSKLWASVPLFTGRGREKTLCDRDWDSQHGTEQVRDSRTWNSPEHCKWRGRCNKC